MRFITGKLVRECSNKWQNRYMHEQIFLPTTCGFFLFFFFLKKKKKLWRDDNIFSWIEKMFFHSWQRVAFEKCICFHKHVYLLYMEQYIFCHPIIYFYRLCFCIYLNKYSILLFQVCEQCNNVKYEREGYFITVDIEKGMQDGQVSFHSSYFVSRFGVDLSVNLVISTRDTSSLCACT